MGLLRGGNMNPRIRRKNKILKVSAVTAIAVGILAAMCLDMDSWIPTIILAICVGYLTIFAIANK